MDRGAARARRRLRRPAARGDATSSPATCPRSTSSTAATSRSHPRRAGRHHRPQRRRQVDAAQGAVRARSRCASGTVELARRGHHRARRRTRSSPRASATCRRTTTCSRGSPSRRTCEMGAVPAARGVRGAVRRRRASCSRCSASGASQRAGSLSGGERQMVAMGRALMMEPVGAAARRAVGRPVAGVPGRGVHPLPPDQRGRRLDRDGRAERPAVPADLPPRLRARPGRQRLHRHRRRAARRPEGHRALPRHPRQSA